MGINRKCMKNFKNNTDKSKNEMKVIAHTNFKNSIKIWMEANNLTAKMAAEIAGISNGVLHSWINRPNDVKFPTFSGFSLLLSNINASKTIPVSRHGRKLNYVQSITGSNFTEYETKLEGQLQKLQEIISEQKGAIKYLESRLTNIE